MTFYASNFDLIFSEDMQDSKPLGLILVGDKNIGTLNDSEEGTAEVVKIGERDET